MTAAEKAHQIYNAKPIESLRNVQGYTGAYDAAGFRDPLHLFGIALLHHEALPGVTNERF